MYFIFPSLKRDSTHIELVEEGRVTALVGPSGGGKSTVASLIPRFWDVREGEGEILIGGVDVRDIPVETLMEDGRAHV